MSDVNEAWGKIAAGFALAGAPKTHVDWIQSEYFRDNAKLGREFLANFKGFGLTTFSSKDAKDRRDLARAMFFGIMLDGKPNYLAEAKAWRARIAETRPISIDAAKASVQAQAAMLYSRSPQQMAAAIAPYLPKEPEPVRIRPAPAAIAPAAPAAVAQRVDPPAKVYDARLRRKWKAIAMASQAGDALLQAGREQAARRDAADEVIDRASGQWSTVWVNARLSLLQEVGNDTNAVLFNFTGCMNAITTAYEGFAENVRENQAVQEARRAMVGKLFAALSYAPPPLSLLGAIGAQAVNLMHVDAALDPRPQYDALRAQAPSGLMQSFVDALKEAHSALQVGAQLGAIVKAASLEEALHGACAAQLTLVRSVLDRVSRDYFGDERGMLDKFRSFRDERLAPMRPAMIGNMHKPGSPKGMLAQMETQVLDSIDAYGKEAALQVRSLMNMKPAITAYGELKYAIELLLYSQYVVALFEDGRSSAALARPLSERIVEVFARTSPWGVVMAGGDGATDEALRQGRLVWKNDANHKKLLLMFCHWYQQNVEPFLMVSGATRDGRIYTPELVQELCRAQVKKINLALVAGRQKTSLGGSSWNWEKINAAYSARGG